MHAIRKINSKNQGYTVSKQKKRGNRTGHGSYAFEWTYPYSRVTTLVTRHLVNIKAEELLSTYPQVCARARPPGFAMALSGCMAYNSKIVYTPLTDP